MLALGRALIGRPQLLLVDELSLGLAPLIVKQIYQQLRVVGDTLGTAMLVVEQNAHLALQFAGSAYLITRGQIVFSGTAAEVAASPAMAETYLGGKRAQDTLTAPADAGDAAKELLS
jgi:branched-chain amino acid transport system ATP-binding protein